MCGEGDPRRPGPLSSERGLCAVILVPVCHHPGDVAEELHPDVLGLLVPPLALLQVRLHGVAEDGAHHAEVVGGDAGVSVELAQVQQVGRALQEGTQFESLFVFALLSSTRKIVGVESNHCWTRSVLAYAGRLGLLKISLVRTFLVNF